MDSNSSFINLLSSQSSREEASSTPAGDDPPHQNFPTQNMPNQNYTPQQNFSGYNPYPPYPNYPRQNPNYPPQNPNYPPQNPNYPPQNPNYPPQNPNFPPQNPNFPPQFPNFPPPANFPGFSQYLQTPVPIKPARVRSSDPQPDAKGRKLWTPDEERVLAGAFLTVSTDSVVGNDQTSKDFWKKVTKYYNENAGESFSRSEKQCKNHHHSMMKTVTEFAGIYNQLASHWPSGASDERIMSDAREAFQRQNDNKPFNKEHIWQLVREEPKWKQQSGFSSSYQYAGSKKTRMNEAGEYTSSELPDTPASHAESNYGSPFQATEEQEPEEPPSVSRRPMGQKAAKRKAKGKGKVGGTSREEAEDDRYTEVSHMLVESLTKHDALQEKIVRSQWQEKLWKLEDKDTSNMTPDAIAKLNARIARIKETWGFE